MTVEWERGEEKGKRGVVREIEGRVKENDEKTVRRQGPARRDQQHNVNDCGA